MFKPLKLCCSELSIIFWNKNAKLKRCNIDIRNGKKTLPRGGILLNSHLIILCEDRPNRVQLFDDAIACQESATVNIYCPMTFDI